MPKAFDTPQADIAAARATEIQAEGFTAVGLYYFESTKYKKLLTKLVAQRLTKAGLWVFSIWENGFPTTGDYFSAAKGTHDGRVAAQKALEAGQPAGTPIYACVDYDASVHDLTGITAYFAAFRAEIAKDGYTAGVYGSGLVCRHLSELGLVEKTWLSQSHGFAGYQDWLEKADIVQGHSTRLLGMDVDMDTTSGSAGGWQVS